MKSIFNYSIALVIVSSLIACGGGHNHEGRDNANKTAGTECVLNYNADSTKLAWTAYKTTEKVAVGGTFDQFKMAGVNQGKTAAEVFENVKFEIISASVNSNNHERDKKISDHFFGIMAQAVEITGTVDEIGEDYADVFIEMNGISMKQKFDLKTDDATYCTIATDLNLEDWDALNSVNALNEICFDLHKGADGESKLWSEVRIELTVQLDKVCP